MEKIVQFSKDKGFCVPNSNQARQTNHSKPSEVVSFSEAQHKSKATSYETIKKLAKDLR